MLRIVLFYVLPFLVPFAAFFAYRFLVTSGQPLLRHTPWFVLSTLGLALVIGSLVTFAMLGGHDRDGVYVPPRFEGGRIVPGHVDQPAVPAPVPDPDAGDD